VDELLVVSPCFYPDIRPAALMLESARRNHLNVELYGIGQPFIPHGADAQVFRLFLFMKEQKRAHHILVTDCRDVLFTAGEGEIMAKMSNFGPELVMSGELGCWPPDPEIVQNFVGRYINAGQYVGTWDYVMHCLEHLLVNYRDGGGLDNSQGWWMYAKMRGELSFAIDSSSEIFQSMSQGADQQVEIRHGRPFNKEHFTWPCSIHYNGNPGNDKPQQEMYRRLYGDAIGSERR
jgi:hypothetical protein